jgi:hypothetical protein
MVFERVVVGAVRVLEDLVVLDLEEATQLALHVALLHARQTHRLSITAPVKHVALLRRGVTNTKRCMMTL